MMTNIEPKRVTKEYVKKTLMDNYSYFLGVSNLVEVEMEAVLRKCDRIIADPLSAVQRTACCTPGYVIFDDDSRLDMGGVGLVSMEYIYNGHTILALHRISKDSYDNIDLHKWMFYFIL